MKSINCKVGDTLVYNDGRYGHVNVKCKVLSAGATSMVVQFEDRVDDTCIKYSDMDWMRFLSVYPAKPQNTDKATAGKIFWYLGGNHMALVEDGGKTFLQVLRSRECDKPTPEMQEVADKMNEHAALLEVEEAADLAETYLEDGAPHSALRVIKTALTNIAAVRTGGAK